MIFDKKIFQTSIKSRFICISSYLKRWGRRSELKRVDENNYFFSVENIEKEGKKWYNRGAVKRCSVANIGEPGPSFGTVLSLCMDAEQ